ncbi:MAG: hypothetical protein QOJ27_2699 [Sphingomonadales bacterium]|nr:hypothetical protein [Sphingomonadales bacterium]
MASELFNFALAFLLFYLASRFLLVAVAMAGLQGEGFASGWMKCAEARGFLRAEARSGELFALGARWLAGLMERITGRGTTRSLTFAFLTATTLFLASLPLAQLQGARADYQSLRRQMTDPSLNEKMPAVACVQEYAMAEIERRIGRPLFNVPAHPRLYPLGDETSATMAAAVPPVPVDLYVRELMNGRKLTADARDILPGMREYPPVAAWLQRTEGNEPIPAEWYQVSPPSPANRTVADRILAFCVDKPSVTSAGFEPIRPRPDYDRIVERFRLGALAIVDDPMIRGSYDLFQQKRAETQLLLSFIYSLGAAFLLLLSMTAGIGLCRLPRRRWGLGRNYGATALALPMIIVFFPLFLAFTSALSTISPLVVGYVVSRSNAGADEADYRRRLSHYIDSVGRLTKRTCADIGPRSPLTPGCRLADAYLEPWNPTTGEFDFSKVVPRTMTNGKPLPAPIAAVFERSMMSFGLAALSMEQDPGLNLTPRLWGGMQSSPTLLLIISPFLLVLSGATALLLVLDARRKLLRRLALPGPG